VSRSSGSLRTALAWGVLWALIGASVLYLVAPNPWPVDGSRIVELLASLKVLDHGGPALLGHRPGTHIPYAIAYAEDQGIYVILPVLCHWLGASNPVTVLRWLWLAAWASTLLSSAVVFRSLFHSSWAALLVSPVLLVCILSFGFGEIYWVTAWIAATLMPPLILLARNRSRRAWLALPLIAFGAGVITSIRSDAGLPTALTACAVAVIVGKRWPVRIAVLVAVAVAYLAPTSIILPVIREHRDHRVGVDLSAREPTSHPFWHSLYIGLGYTPNRYNIHYLDSYGGAAVHELDPAAAFKSAAYERTLHKQVDALIEHDPSFVATAEAQKIVVELFLAAPYALLLALLLPAALTARGRARLRPYELALFIPALLIGALPAIVAVPYRDYELALLGPLGVLDLLAIGSTARRAQEQWLGTAGAAVRSIDRTRLMLRGTTVAWPLRSTRWALLAAAIVIVPVSLFARHLEAEHGRWDSKVTNSPMVKLAAARLDAARTDA
jgi:hypothetical protein